MLCTAGIPNLLAAKALMDKSGFSTKKVTIDANINLGKQNLKQRRVQHCERSRMLIVLVTTFI